MKGIINSPAAISTKKRSPEIAAILNFLITGVGYMYLGEWAWGISAFIFIGGILGSVLIVLGGFVIGTLLYLPIDIILALHAYKLAEEINKAPGPFTSNKIQLKIKELMNYQKLRKILNLVVLILIVLIVPPMIIGIFFQGIAFLIIALVIYFFILISIEKLKFDEKTKKILFLVVFVLYVFSLGLLARMLGGIPPDAYVP